MASANLADSDSTLIITRIFDAAPERVFDTWLDARAIAKWIGPRVVKAETLELTPQIGGRYRIHMRGTDGSAGPTVGGTYREIVRPERLVFTWKWETGHPMGAAGQETLITLTFRAAGAGKTEMTLRHEMFETKESRDSHNQGWNASFDKMAEMLAENRAGA
jgi:uncharacterized protein YndB with AHSA1/START domain